MDEGLGHYEDLAVQLRPAAEVVVGGPQEMLSRLVTAFELVHVPARIERWRRDEYRLAVPGLVLAGREVVAEIARVVAPGIQRAVLELEVDSVRAHAHQEAEGPRFGDVMQRGDVIAVVGGSQVGHGSLRCVEMRPCVPGCRSRLWRRRRRRSRRCLGGMAGAGYRTLSAW